MIRRLALAMVRRYPAAWRERYETEVSALIRDSPARVRDLGDLLHGLITERARELVAADDRPKRTAAVLAWMPAAFILTFTAVAIALGLVLQRVAGRWSETQEEALGWAIVSLLFALVAVHIVTTVRHRRRPQPKPPMPQAPAWLAGLLLPCVFVAVVCATWAGVLLAQSDSDSLPWGLHAFTRGYLYLMLLDHLTSSLWPRRDLLHAFAALGGAEGWLRVNEAWVVSCREWIAKGVSSPLNDALAQVGYWTIERDSARARLQALGYRARFRWPPTSR
jgi:hypothetical protein